MSFMLTTDQFKDRTKTVTRRLNWTHVKEGEVITGCVKCMGLKPGEKIKKLGQIRIVKLTRERLDRMNDREYGDQEAVKEGFPNLSGPAFVKMFCEHQKVKPNQVITRIEFEYLEEKK